MSRLGSAQEKTKEVMLDELQPWFSAFEHSLTLPKRVKSDESTAPYERDALELAMSPSPGRKIPVEVGRHERTQLDHQAHKAGKRKRTAS